MADATAPKVAAELGVTQGAVSARARQEGLKARHQLGPIVADPVRAVGRTAVEFAIAGRNAVMPAIRRLSDAPYQWDIVEAPLSEVANKEKLLPLEFISPDGFGITDAARRYLAPLIVGEAYPPYKSGLPDYAKLAKVAVQKKLTKAFDIRVSAHLRDAPELGA